MAGEPDNDAVHTMCAYCGVGCGMVLQVTTDPKTGRRHMATSMGNEHHPANFGRLCTKGITTADLLHAPGRMESAYLRADRGEPPQAVDMDNAITQCARIRPGGGALRRVGGGRACKTRPRNIRAGRRRVGHGNVPFS